MRHSSSLRYASLVGRIAPFWFVASYVLTASLRRDYRHLNMAISELGSVGAPNALLWNIAGYVLPGIAVACLGAASRQALPNSRRALSVSLSIALSGFFLAFAGIFPGDFEQRHSPTMILHTVGSLLSYAFFLIGGFALAGLSAELPIWQRLHRALLVVLVLSILTGFLRVGAFPGLGQRLTFLCYWVWIFLYASALTRTSDTT